MRSSSSIQVEEENNTMNRAVVVSGHVSVGKTSIIRLLADAHSWDIVSFGNYVRHEAQRRNLPSTRRAYQDLGWKLFTGSGARLFLKEVIDYHGPTSNVHIFDGVRDPTIVDELRNLYGGVFVAHLVASDQVRYARYKARLGPTDVNLQYSEFLAISEHPIERGISGLASVADAVVDSSRHLANVYAEVQQRLAEQGFL